jgi:hypothetical protein
LHISRYDILGLGNHSSKITQPGSEAHGFMRGNRSEALPVSRTGFSLPDFCGRAEFKTRQAEAPPTKSKAPEGWTRGRRAAKETLRSLGMLPGESAGYATPRKPPKRIRNNGDTPSLYDSSKIPVCEARLNREPRP